MTRKDYVFIADTLLLLAGVTTPLAWEIAFGLFVNRLMTIPNFDQTKFRAYVYARLNGGRK